jgi:hypothetical protein
MDRWEGRGERGTGQNSFELMEPTEPRPTKK